MAGFGDPSYNTSHLNLPFRTINLRNLSESVDNRRPCHGHGSVFRILQNEFSQLDRDLLNGENSQEVCCEPVRQSLDEIYRLLARETLRCFGNRGIIDRPINVVS